MRRLAIMVLVPLTMVAVAIATGRSIEPAVISLQNPQSLIVADTQPPGDIGVLVSPVATIPTTSEPAAVAVIGADRGDIVQVTPTQPPPPSTTTTTTTLPPTTTIPSGSWKCSQWFNTAIEAGWPVRLWSQLDHVMWGESRCNPNVLNDRGQDYSFGLLQINVKEGIGTRAFFAPLLGCVSTSNCDWTQLFDPYTNLRVAWARYEANLTAGWTRGCGWWGWTVARKAGFC